jgi:hypothetical protein
LCREIVQLKFIVLKALVYPGLNVPKYLFLKNVKNRCQLELL